MSKEIKVPDIGDYTDVEIIEVSVKPGDEVSKDDTLITLETDKATLEVPSPLAGVVEKVIVKVGERVAQGSVILHIAAAAEKEPAESKKIPETIPEPSTKPPEIKAEVVEQPPTVAQQQQSSSSITCHAGPAVRQFARELGVALDKVKGTGRKGRILKHDVTQYIKARLNSSAEVSGQFPQMPTIDFSQFGSVDKQSLSRIKKLSGTNLHRNWVIIPHVTQFDEADITELESFRKSQKTLAEKQGVKLTPLVFLMKAVVAGLQKFPQFNSSLTPDGQELILKNYFHIGVAVDTPNGLVVPVVRDVNQKGLFQLAGELGTISQKARESKLTGKDMQGGCFTISSLGGIGGTAFTPIVNAPEVAILGVSKSKTQPVYVENALQPRLVLPLSLSYDHRVIDGAEAVRFTSFLVDQLADIRRLLL